jgi:hypothetical protein
MALALCEAIRGELPSQSCNVATIEPSTVFIFTANDTERLQDRFLSRCMVLQFQSHGMAKEAACLLERIWLARQGS